MLGVQRSVCFVYLFIWVKKIPKECKLPLFLAVKQHHTAKHNLLGCVWCYGAEISKPIAERWERK